MFGDALLVVLVGGFATAILCDALGVVTQRGAIGVSMQERRKESESLQQPQRHVHVPTPITAERVERGSGQFLEGGPRRKDASAA